MAAGLFRETLLRGRVFRLLFILGPLARSLGRLDVLGTDLGLAMTLLPLLITDMAPLSLKVPVTLTSTIF